MPEPEETLTLLCGGGGGGSTAGGTVTVNVLLDEAEAGVKAVVFA